MISSAKFRLLLLFSSCVCFKKCLGETKNYAYHTVLDGGDRYHLYWSPPGFIDDLPQIHFKVEVKTHGYVGFGLSPNGGMAGSDIVIGYIRKDGKVFFEDRYAVGKQLPEIDEKADWFLTHASENETHTVLEFYRALDTCDEKDMKIDDSTMRLIYAFSEEDPALDHIQYHSSNRGSKSALLLQPKLPSLLEQDKSKLLYWDVLSPNHSFPSSVRSLYWCKNHKAPELEKKHHIVMVEPLLQPGHEEFVHHMLLYECVGGSQDEYEPLLDYEGHECHRENMPDPMKRCEGVFLAWGVGGNALILPDDVGIPIESGTSTYFMLEIHYDNPSKREAQYDNSGFRIYYTPHLRKYDGGNLMIGSTVSPRHFIPPGRKEYVVSGHSSPDCLGPVMKKEGVQILGVFLHAHLIGRRLKVRHFRNGTELPHLARDDNYDFNYQDYRLFANEITLLPDDQLTVECTYDSSKRIVTTFGGESTSDEMCLAFILHYPKLQRFASLSLPTVDEIKKAIEPNKNVPPLTYNFDWSAVNLNDTERILRYSQQDTFCYLGNGTKNTIKSLITYPRILEEYKPEDTWCVDNSALRKSFSIITLLYYILYYILYYFSS